MTDDMQSNKDELNKVITENIEVAMEMIRTNPVVCSYVVIVFADDRAAEWEDDVKKGISYVASELTEKMLPALAEGSKQYPGQTVIGAEAATGAVKMSSGPGPSKFINLAGSEQLEEFLDRARKGKES